MKKKIKATDWIFALFWILLLLTFIIWTRWWFLSVTLLFIIDYFLLKTITRKPINLPSPVKSIIDWTVTLLIALILTTGIKILFIEAYKIPTPSMEKTLLAGDFLFVSKISYGPKLPMTPLSLPFLPDMLPNGKVTYSQKKTFPYKRLKGLTKVKRNDIIVFNFPEGDSVVVQYSGQNYYSLLRQYGRKYLHSKFDVIYHPVDRRNNYIKRCVGLPGDTLQIHEGTIMVNHKINQEFPYQQFKYYVRTFNGRLADTILNKVGTSTADISFNPNNSLHIMPLSNQDVGYIKKLSEVKSLQRFVEPHLSVKKTEVFPHDSGYRWTTDEFGPVIIPGKNMTIPINLHNLPVYRRIINVYENNKLTIKEGDIYINDTLSRYYTFKMDYYFVLGDNRHNSADSRFWGFVPEDHLVGKAVLTWFSKDPNQDIFHGLRINRMFKSIK